VTLKEIKSSELNAADFIRKKTTEIKKAVGKGYAITALSGGVDSSVVTMLGYRALDLKLRVCFVDNGLMRKGEPENIALVFQKLGINVAIISAQDVFFRALQGITDPEKKREAITQTFYKDVFAKLVRESGARCLLQGTILTDIEETVAGVKRQHNVFEQLGIDPEKEFGYKIIEPLIQLRKDGVRIVAKELGLPESIYNRMPFPGPALAARVIGEVTSHEIKLVRMATKITEEVLGDTKAFQYLAILHKDRVTGVKNGKREFGRQIEIRCWDSTDARIAVPTKLPSSVLDLLSSRITKEVPEVVSVTYNITPKPPSTIEAI
jgi:GMP synthase (glutamine-hydrolysing)